MIESRIEVTNCVCLCMARWNFLYLVACYYLVVELWEANHGITMSVESKYIGDPGLLDI